MSSETPEKNIQETTAQRQQQPPEPAAEAKPEKTRPAAASPLYLSAPGLKLPSHLGVVAEFIPEAGYVRIRRSDGKPEEQMPAGQVALMAHNCLEQLDAIEAAEIKHQMTFPLHFKKQLQELFERATRAAHAAMHKRQNIGRHDTENKAVDRMLTGLEWQKGMRKDLGEHTEAHLHEDANLRYYATRFEYLTESEIATVLRAEALPWKHRVKMLQAMNGKRMMEEAGMNAAEVASTMATGKLPETAVSRLQAARKASGRRRKA